MTQTIAIGMPVVSERLDPSAGRADEGGFLPVLREVTAPSRSRESTGTADDSAPPDPKGTTESADGSPAAARKAPPEPRNPIDDIPPDVTALILGLLGGMPAVPPPPITAPVAPNTAAGIAPGATMTATAPGAPSAAPELSLPAPDATLAAPPITPPPTIVNTAAVSDSPRAPIAPEAPGQTPTPTSTVVTRDIAAPAASPVPAAPERATSTTPVVASAPEAVRQAATNAAAASASQAVASNAVPAGAEGSKTGPSAPPPAGEDTHHADQTHETRMTGDVRLLAPPRISPVSSSAASTDDGADDDARGDRRGDAGVVDAPPRSEATPAVNVASGRPAAAAVESPARGEATPEIRQSVVDQIVQRVSMSTGAGRHEVSLGLDPPELGRVRVEIVVTGGQVQMQIHAEHESTRELLAGAVPRLRESLAAQGLTTERVTVQLGLDSSPRDFTRGQPGSSYPQGGETPPPGTFRTPSPSTVAASSRAPVDGLELWV